MILSVTIASLVLAPISAPAESIVPKLLCVDSMVLAQFKNKNWTAVPYTYGTGIGPFDLVEVKIGALGKSIHALGIEPLSKDAFEAIGGAPILKLAPESDLDTGALISGMKPTFPRKVTKATPNSYLSWTKAFLSSKGYIKVTPRVVQAWSVDLDGDGKLETLVEIRNRDNLTTETDWKKSDYSAILVRTKNKTINLAYTGKSCMDLTMHRIHAIADLDQDGQLEVVTSWHYYEGGGADLWRMSKGKMKKLVGVGGGA